jgi:hypothetical protein
MSVVIPEEYKGRARRNSSHLRVRQLARGAFLRGADAERARCIEIILQCEERGDWTATAIIKRLQEGLT